MHEKWDEVAQHFANDSRLAFAKIDVENNDLTGTDAQGSPLYEIWPAHMKMAREEPQVVGTYDSIISFVQSYSTHYRNDKMKEDDAAKEKEAKELEE